MPDIVQREGDLLVVPHGFALAPICVGCAGRHGVTNRLEEMTHVSFRAWAIAAGLMVAGWLLCAVALDSLVITIALPMLFALAIVLRRLTHRAVVSLPVCASCDVRWRGAARAKSLATLSLVPGTALAAAALFLLPSSLAAPVSGALLVAWVVAFNAWSWAIARRNALVMAASIDRHAARLRGVDPEALREIVAAASRDGVYR